MTQTTGRTIEADRDDPLLAPMPRRKLGRTGWEASLLTLGGVKWDTRLTEAEAIALVHRAIELGVNTFDTAAAYSNGQSERRLGKALAGRRDEVWIDTKTGKRDAGEARRQIDESLDHLATDRIDLLFVHALDDDEDCRRVLAPNSVLKTIEEYQRAGHVRFVGVSGHWYKHNMKRILEAYPFDAALMPAGLANVAYDYDFMSEVAPVARARGAAVMGMKVFAAGRVQHAASVEPYLRYSLNQPIDTAVIGCDSIAQLEQTVRIVKQQPPPLSPVEQANLLPEAIAITQSFDKGEFSWVQHYVKDG